MSIQFQQKNVESVYFPIIQKVYGGQGNSGMPPGFDPSMFSGAGMPGASSQSNNNGPNVEELDQ